MKPPCHVWRNVTSEATPAMRSNRPNGVLYWFHAASYYFRLLARAFAMGLFSLAMVTASAQADDRLKRPDVDTSGLPVLAPGWAEINPLRGNTQAIAIGREAFNQTCARCHGENANGMRSPAPDLRRIGMSCQRVKDADLNHRCQSDADHFFIKSVRFGKQKFGIIHMPPWEGVLEPALVWSLRSFTESAPRN